LDGHRAADDSSLRAIDRGTEDGREALTQGFVSKVRECFKNPALCQGMTLVGPKRAEKPRALAPEGFRQISSERFLKQAILNG
jgi:hypothetical protein